MNKKIGCVIPVRNDGYGKIGDYTLNDRATYCINSAIHNYDVVYLVDWNSPAHPLLWDIKNDISFKGNLRHIIIQPEDAKLLTNNDPDAAVCCEVLCRNIGIRKLINDNIDWIISTNIDIIAPNRSELNDLLVNNTINNNTFYTISRRGVDWNTITKFFVDNDIERNSKNLSFKSWELLQKYLVNNIPERHYGEAVVKGDNYSLINCAGDLQIAHKDIWNTIRGFEEELIYTLYSDTNVQKKAVMHGFELKALYNPALFHINHGKGGGGFMDGINKKVNDMGRAVIFQHHTQNSSDWGFSNIEIEYESV